MGEIPSYNAITEPTNSDLLVVVDVNDTSMSAQGTTKKMTFGQLYGSFAPWLFTPEAYGAKGDGQLALVTVVNGNATINTTPLGAPSAPTVNHSGSGGTVANGTYKAVVTYVNKWGETTGSSSTSVTTTGSGTSTITISSPAPYLDATGWNAYVTAAGGSTEYLQNPTPNAINVAFTLTAPPTTSTANPPGSDTTPAQVFNASTDVGKNIMICGADGTPGGPCIDTIASVNSSTQAVITTAGNITASAAGCAMVFSSDDRMAIDSCMTAARNYALANNSMCKVQFRDRIYGVGTGLFQTAVSNNTGTWTYNTQVRLPVANPSGEVNKFEVQVLGAGDGGHCQFWLSPNLNMTGTAIVSYTVGPNTSPDATYGQQSIVGGPIGGFLSAANGFSNSKAVVKGITLVQPGWSNSIGLDLNGMSECNIDGVTSTAFAPSDSVVGAVNPYSGWNNQSFWINNKIAAGVRLPAAQNNDEVLVNSLCVQGLNIGVLSGADHVVINRLSINSLDTVISLSLGGNNQHSFTAVNVSPENYNVGIKTTGTGSKVQCNIMWDAEVANIAGADVSDATNQLTGVFLWNDIARSPAVPTVTGAANLSVINCQLGPGYWSGAPAVPATTVAVAQSAMPWRPAWVTITSGGAAVSAITVNGQATGLTLGSSGSVAVRVPTGGTIALTYASTAPTWNWWLD